MIDFLKQQLSKKIDKTLIDELFREYKNILDNFYINDLEKVLSSSGRFLEIVLAILSYLNDGKTINLNGIKFDQLHKRIISFSKKTGEEELLYLEIPRIADAMYTIRSKKRGAHRKDLDPIVQDALLIKTSADWIIASFLFLYHTKSDKEINQLISSILEKKIPFIQEFEDGGIKILKKIEFKWQVLLLLYHQNTFVSKKELTSLSKPKYPQLLDTSLRDIGDNNLIYEGKEGFRITKLGIEKVEKDLMTLKNY